MDDTTGQLHDTAAGAYFSEDDGPFPFSSQMRALKKRGLTSDDAPIRSTATTIVNATDDVIFDVPVSVNGLSSASNYVRREMDTSHLANGQHNRHNEAPASRATSPLLFATNPSAHESLPLQLPSEPQGPSLQHTQQVPINPWLHEQIHSSHQHYQQQQPPPQPHLFAFHTFPQQQPLSSSHMQQKSGLYSGIGGPFDILSTSTPATAPTSMSSTTTLDVLRNTSNINPDGTNRAFPVGMHPVPMQTSALQHSFPLYRTASASPVSVSGQLDVTTSGFDSDTDLNASPRIRLGRYNTVTGSGGLYTSTAISGQHMSPKPSVVLVSHNPMAQELSDGANHSSMLHAYHHQLNAGNSFNVFTNTAVQNLASTSTTVMSIAALAQSTVSDHGENASLQLHYAGGLTLSHSSSAHAIMAPYGGYHHVTQPNPTAAHVPHPQGAPHAPPSFLQPFGTFADGNAAASSQQGIRPATHPNEMVDEHEGDGTHSAFDIDVGKQQETTATSKVQQLRPVRVWRTAAGEFALGADIDIDTDSIGGDEGDDEDDGSGYNELGVPSHSREGQRGATGNIGGSSRASRSSSSDTGGGVGRRVLDATLFPLQLASRSASMVSTTSSNPRVTVNPNGSNNSGITPRPQLHPRLMEGVTNSFGTRSRPRNALPQRLRAGMVAYANGYGPPLSQQRSIGRAGMWTAATPTTVAVGNATAAASAAATAAVLASTRPTAMQSNTGPLQSWPPPALSPPATRGATTPTSVPSNTDEAASSITASTAGTKPTRPRSARNLSIAGIASGTNSGAISPSRPTSFSLQRTTSVSSPRALPQQMLSQPLPQPWPPSGAMSPNSMPRLASPTVSNSGAMSPSMTPAPVQLAGSKRVGPQRTPKLAAVGSSSSLAALLQSQAVLTSQPSPSSGTPALSPSGTLGPLSPAFGAMTVNPSQTNRPRGASSMGISSPGGSNTTTSQLDTLASGPESASSAKRLSLRLRSTQGSGPNPANSGSQTGSMGASSSGGEEESTPMIAIALPSLPTSASATTDSGTLLTATTANTTRHGLRSGNRLTQSPYGTRSGVITAAVSATSVLPTISLAPDQSASSAGLMVATHPTPSLVEGPTSTDTQQLSAPFPDLRIAQRHIARARRQEKRERVGELEREVCAIFQAINRLALHQWGQWREIAATLRTRLGEHSIAVEAWRKLCDQVSGSHSIMPPPPTVSTSFSSSVNVNTGLTASGNKRLLTARTSPNMDDMTTSNDDGEGDRYMNSDVSLLARPARLLTGYANSPLVQTSTHSHSHSQLALPTSNPTAGTSSGALHSTNTSYTGGHGPSTLPLPSSMTSVDATTFHIKRSSSSNNTTTASNSDVAVSIQPVLPAFSARSLRPLSGPTLASTNISPTRTASTISANVVASIPSSAIVTHARKLSKRRDVLYTSSYVGADLFPSLSQPIVEAMALRDEWLTDIVSTHAVAAVTATAPTCLPKAIDSALSTTQTTASALASIGPAAATVSVNPPSTTLLTPINAATTAVRMVPVLEGVLAGVSFSARTAFAIQCFAEGVAASGTATTSTDTFPILTGVHIINNNSKSGSKSSSTGPVGNDVITVLTPALFTPTTISTSASGTRQADDMVIDTLTNTPSSNIVSPTRHHSVSVSNSSTSSRLSVQFAHLTTGLLDVLALSPSQARVIAELAIPTAHAFSEATSTAAFITSLLTSASPVPVPASNSTRSGVLRTTSSNDMKTAMTMHGSTPVTSTPAGLPRSSPKLLPATVSSPSLPHLPNSPLFSVPPLKRVVSTNALRAHTAVSTLNVSSNSTTTTMDTTLAPSKLLFRVIDQLFAPLLPLCSEIQLDAYLRLAAVNTHIISRLPLPSASASIAAIARLTSSAPSPMLTSIGSPKQALRTSSSNSSLNALVMPPSSTPILGSSGNSNTMLNTSTGSGNSGLKRGKVGKSGGRSSIGGTSKGLNDRMFNSTVGIIPMDDLLPPLTGLQGSAATVTTSRAYLPQPWIQLPPTPPGFVYLLPIPPIESMLPVPYPPLSPHTQAAILKAMLAAAVAQSPLLVPVSPAVKGVTSSPALGGVPRTTSSSSLRRAASNLSLGALGANSGVFATTIIVPGSNTPKSQGLPSVVRKTSTSSAMGMSVGGYSSPIHQRMTADHIESTSLIVGPASAASPQHQQAHPTQSSPPFTILSALQQEAAGRQHQVLHQTQRQKQQQSQQPPPQS